MLLAGGGHDSRRVELANDQAAGERACSTGAGEPAAAIARPATAAQQVTPYMVHLQTACLLATRAPGPTLGDLASNTRRAGIRYVQGSRRCYGHSSVDTYDTPHGLGGGLSSRIHWNLDPLRSGRVYGRVVVRLARESSLARDAAAFRLLTI